MIFCFSGTGNSRYIANRIAQGIQDEIVDLNEKIKSNDNSPVEVKGDVIVVTPTYAWRVPRIVSEWLRNTELKGAERVWFVMSCGMEIGNAAEYNISLAQEMGLCYMGTTRIVMPDNYIAMFDTPQKSEAEVIVGKSQPAIDAVISCIKEGKSLNSFKHGMQDRAKSRVVNNVFYKVLLKSSAFEASDACTGCGLCAQKCPTNCISLKGGKPVWTDNCTHCMACISYCPSKAIEYGKKSLGKPRYHFEELDIK